MAGVTRPFFDLLDGVWGDIRPRLPGTFTTQEFQNLLQDHAPEVWSQFVERWGPGGKGTGNFYSPANVLNNYLKEKTRNALLIDKRFVPSKKGWGAAVVNQWQFVAAEDLPASEEDWQFAEGKLIRKLHLFRERDAGVRKALLRTRSGSKLFCDICLTTGDHLEEDVRDAMFEAHHSNAPISEGERSTKKDDMALLCACCHRLLHRLVRIRGDWITVDQAKKLIYGP